MNHPEDHIIQSLLEKHALGLCTPEERKVLHQWYEAFPEKGPVFKAEAERDSLKNDMKASLFEAIRPAETVRIRPVFWRIAAAVLLLVATGTLFYLISKRTTELSYVEVIAPQGKGVMKFTLSDQSTVWLQAGSTLRYQEGFGSAGRNLELVEGMAHFSVQRHSNLPFMVSTSSGLKAKVLGTAFTIKAYRELADVKVYVASGAVQISESDHVLAVLKANRQLVYNTGTHGFREESIDAGNFARWTAGEIILDNASFAELARVLKDRFNADIRYDSLQMEAYRFNLQITNGSSLRQVFEMLGEISGIDYTINGKQVTIKGVHP